MRLVSFVLQHVYTVVICPVDQKNVQELIGINKKSSRELLPIVGLEEASEERTGKRSETALG